MLDKLARQKGRLLKGGEPDLESVAKILLSDWVRGKIPFFVPPPERPEELNKEEAAKRKKADKKGKQRAVEGEGEQKQERHLIGVKQNIGSIMQNNSFLGDDVRPLEEEQDEMSEQDLGSEGESKESSVKEDEGLAWDDVFNEDRGLVPQDSETANGKVTSKNCSFQV